MGNKLKNVLEPAVIVLLFTLGTLVNRRTSNPAGPKCSRRHQDDDVEEQQAPLEAYDDGFASSESTLTSSLEESPPLKPIHLLRQYSERRSPNVFFRLLSLFWNKFPFLCEIWVYQLLRAYTARSIAGNQAIFDRARDHALQILSIERALGLDVELGVQQTIMRDHPRLLKALAFVYHSHICVGVGFFIYAYTHMPATAFSRIRRTLAANNAISFAVLTLWRCAPPRLLPAEHGFVDVMHGHLAPGVGSAWTDNKYRLTIAAMPSLHFGTALFMAVCAWRWAPHGPLRVVGWLWPAVMLLTIVATANHFLLDALVGACVPLLGWRLNRVWLRLKPLHDWVFSPLARRMDPVEEAVFEGEWYGL